MTPVNVYQNYHSKSRLQKRVISEKDFTYRNIIDVAGKYLVRGNKILDIGSATGTLSFYFASRGLQVDGVELSENAFKYANLNKTNLKIKNVNFINTPIEKFHTTKKYDIVTCFEVLEHLVDDVSILKKINKIMNPNSVLMISVPSKNAPLYKLGFLNNFDKKVGHLRRYSDKEIKSVLQLAGFRLVKLIKSESVLRNILYTNNFFGLIVKITKFNIVNDLISFLDKIFLKILGESQIIIVSKKV